MKSIDEFATEYAQDKYLPVQTSQAVKAGANYVLGEIEELTCLSGEALKIYLTRKIKELKGE